MRKILAVFAFVALIFYINSVSASNIAAPQFPSGWFSEPFINKLDCGTFQEFYLYDLDTGTVWTKIFFEGDEKPLFLTKYQRSSEIWIDKDRDGHIDEYFSSESAFRKRYRSICDVLTK